MKRRIGTTPQRGGSASQLKAEGYRWDSELSATTAVGQPRGKSQVVTDELGRQRFHGAFTGGFSAGYFNTVGSESGWKPSEWKSVRDGGLAQSVADVMDAEDRVVVDIQGAEAVAATRRREAGLTHFNKLFRKHDDVEAPLMSSFSMLSISPISVLERQRAESLLRLVFPMARPNWNFAKTAPIDAECTFLVPRMSVTNPDAALQLRPALPPGFGGSSEVESPDHTSALRSALREYLLEWGRATLVALGNMRSKGCVIQKRPRPEGRMDELGLGGSKRSNHVFDSSFTYDDEGDIKMYSSEFGKDVMEIGIQDITERVPAVDMMTVIRKSSPEYFRQPSDKEREMISQRRGPPIAREEAAKFYASLFEGVSKFRVAGSGCAAEEQRQVPTDPIVSQGMFYPSEELCRMLDIAEPKEVTRRKGALLTQKILPEFS